MPNLPKDYILIRRSLDETDANEDDETSLKLPFSTKRVAILFLVLFGVFGVLSCVTFNHAFPFDLTQLYSTVNVVHSTSVPRVQSDYQDNVWTPAPKRRSRIKSTTTKKPSRLSQTTLSMTTTTTTTTSTTTEAPTTTMKPAMKKNGKSNGKSTTKKPKTKATATPKATITTTPSPPAPVITVKNYNKKKITPFPRTSDVVVETKLGKIKGMTGDIMGRDVNGFLGIPYAKPPVDGLRFKRSVKLNSFKKFLPNRNNSELFDATYFRHHCLQDFREDLLLSRSLTTLEMSEDCLYLNIWTPVMEESSALKPVIVYIYGNGFKGGSANFDETDGRVLSALGDVVVVTFNYRSGVLGFLDLENDESPGNQGLYDMVNALSFVSENIEAFNGDANRVTLMGHYSGAVAAGFFLTNSKTMGLFQRAILQSGSPLFQDYFQGKNLKSSEAFVDEVGCSHCVNLKQKLECLRGKTIAELLSVEKPLLKMDNLMFGPTHCESLLPETSFNQLQDDSISLNVKQVLMGSTRDELSLSLIMDFPEIFNNKRININVTSLRELRQLIVKIFSGKSSIQQDMQSIEYLAEYFFTDHPTLNGSLSMVETTEELIRKMYRVFGDAAVGCPVNIFAEHLDRKGVEIYMYEFNQRALNTPWGSWMGVPLGMEIPYIFGHPLRYPRMYSQDDLVVSKRMIATWSQFAKNGTVPLQLNQSWEKFKPHTPSFLEITPNEVAYGSRDNNPVCNLFRVALKTRNDTFTLDLDCNPRISGGVVDGDDILFETTTQGEDGSTTFDGSTTEATTVAVIIRCTPFIDDIDGPSIDYYNYEVIDLKITPVKDTRALFYCDPDQELIGEQVSTCTENGWTSEKPNCTIIKPGSRRPENMTAIPRFHCDFFKDPLDDPRLSIKYEKLYELNETVSFAIKGSTAHFTCKALDNEKFEMIGQEKVTCSKYGIWSSIEPKCEVKLEKIEIFMRDYKRQYFVLSLIIVLALSVCFITVQIYTKLSTPDIDVKDYEKKQERKRRKEGRVIRKSLEKLPVDSEREEQLLLRTDKEFSLNSSRSSGSRSTSRTAGSSISAEDLEIIEILARDSVSRAGKDSEGAFTPQETEFLQHPSKCPVHKHQYTVRIQTPPRVISRTNFPRKFSNRRNFNNVSKKSDASSISETQPLRPTPSLVSPNAIRPNGRSSSRGSSGRSSSGTSRTTSSSEAETVLWVNR